MKSTGLPASARHGGLTRPLYVPTESAQGVDTIEQSRRMGIKGAPHMLVAWDRLGGGRETLEVRRHVKG